MAKSWCKVASNLDSHPKIRRAGRNGREVFLFALRRNAEPDNPVPGRLPAAMLEPWYLADQLMMSEEEAVTGVTACRHAGLLVQDGASWVINGWDEDWGKKPVEGAERTRKWRGKLDSNPSVTAVTSHNVTESHGDGCDALDQRRSEERRLEEKRGDQNPDSATLSAGGGSPGLFALKAKVDTATGDIGKRRARKSKPSEHSESERAIAMRVLDRLGKRNGVSYTGAAEHVRLIVNQLRAGVSELELRAVGAYCQESLGWGTDKPEMGKYLTPETLYGPKTITRYLDPARTWARDALAEARADQQIAEASP